MSTNIDLQDVILDKLTGINVKYVKSGDNFLLSTCLSPEHDDNKPSFSINTTTGFSKCFTCGYTIGSEFWLNGVLDDEQLELLERNKIYKQLKHRGVCNNIKQVVNIFPPKSSVPDGYRGLSIDTLNKFDIYLCKKGKYKDRVVFPINEQHFETRSLKDCPNKYMHSYGFSPKSFIYPLSYIKDNIGDYLVITEGIIDCINLNQDGIPSVCNFGVANNLLSKHNITTLISTGVDRLYLMFDDDEYGHAATLMFKNDDILSEYFEVLDAKRLSALSDFYKSGCKDYNEFTVMKMKG